MVLEKQTRHSRCDKKPLFRLSQKASSGLASLSHTSREIWDLGIGCKMSQQGKSSASRESEGGLVGWLAFEGLALQLPPINCSDGATNFTSRSQNVSTPSRPAIPYRKFIEKIIDKHN